MGSRSRLSSKGPSKMTPSSGTILGLFMSWLANIYCDPRIAGYTLWQKTDFSGKLLGNSDCSLFTAKNLTDAISVCNSLGAGCVAATYDSSHIIQLKKTIAYPNFNSSILGTYIKAIPGYVIISGVDLNPSMDAFAVSMNNIECTSYCNTQYGCIGVVLSSSTGLCYGKDHYRLGRNDGVLSFIQVNQIILIQ